MFVGERNLWYKIREGYKNYPETQRLLGELCKGKTFKEVRFVNGLPKHKQRQVYVP
jgi:hypothetical protein